MTATEIYNYAVIANSTVTSFSAPITNLIAPAEMLLIVTGIAILLFVLSYSMGMSIKSIKQTNSEHKLSLPFISRDEEKAQ
jgi:hypothetical protein